jgi:hypothetical protein
VSPWRTLWAVGVTPFHVGSAGEGLLALAAIAFGGAAYLALRGRTMLAARAAVLLAGGVAAFLVSRTVQHVIDYEACARADLLGQGKVVEGEIRDFRPLTSVLQEPPFETFRVGDELVSMPLFAESCGYHRTRVEGGPFREGMEVRLRIWQGNILRVEVKP